MSPYNNSQSDSAETSAAGATPDIPICLDFLKGRCTRSQCRFLHPDLSQYQQLSGAVQAQAGRHVCEVWAMTGQCKFGAKCSRLHPSVVVNPQPQPVMTLLLPLAVVPHAVLKTPATEAPPSPITPPSPLSPDFLLPGLAGWPPLPAAPLRPPPTLAGPGLLLPFVAPPAPGPNPLNLAAASTWPASPPMAPAVAVAAAAPRHPQHVAPPAAQGQPAALQDWLQALAAEAGRRDARTVAPITQGRATPPAPAERGRSLACLFDAEYQADQPTPDQPTRLEPSPALKAPQPPRRRSANPQHQWDRAYLDMLRHLHNAGRQLS